MVSVTVGISVLELAFGVVAAFVARAAWQSRAKPAGFPVFVLTTAGCLYATVNGLESLVDGYTLTVLFGHLRWPLGGLVAVGTFYTAVEYTNRRQLQRPAVLAALCGLVVLDFVAFLTNPFHELLLADFGVESGLFVSTSGEFLWVHLVVFFGIAALGLLQLAQTYRDRPVHRRQTAAVVTGIGIAFGFFALESVVSVHPAFNLATAGIVVGSGVLLWAIDRVQLLETVPVARETLMDNMDEYIVALDTENRIVDANQLAREFLDAEADLLGQSVDDVFEAYPKLLAAIETTTQTERELTLQVDGQYRYYHLSVTPITDDTGFVDDTGDEVGRLVVVNDVTEQRRRKEELDLLKQVFARVLRHNMRNDLNVIAGNAKLLSEQVPASEEEHASVVLECARDMLDMTEKARDLEAIIESPGQRVAIDLTTVVESVVTSIRDSYPDVTVNTSVDESCQVLAHPELETAVRNVVENACEHDTSPPTTVEITTRVEADRVILRIVDDGPGIPDHEIDVLESGAESSLKHGSGLGLWIIKWVTNRSDATIDINADQSGSAVTFNFMRADGAISESSARDSTEAQGAATDD